MQDPNQDTEWNDILRAKGILPAKEKAVTEEDIVQLVEQTVAQKMCGQKLEDLSLDELDELEDDEEERVLEQYRRKRIAEIQALHAKSRFGDVREISAEDYVEQVNKAGDGVWVVLLLYKQGTPLCALINKYLLAMASKFPTVKFLRSIATTCIPNYPDQNVPTLFVYFEGEMKAQLIGPHRFRGTNLTEEEFEFLLGKTGAIETSIKEDPRPAVQDVLLSRLANDDHNDW